MKRWAIAVIALALCAAAPALAEEQQQPQKYQTAVPPIATPDMVPWRPSRDRGGNGGNDEGAWTAQPNDWWANRFNNNNNNNNWPQRRPFDGDLSKDFDPLFSRPVLRGAWRPGAGGGFNNNRPWGTPPTGLESAWRRGFLGSGVPVRDLDWAKGVTADGKEFDVPLPTSSGQWQGLRRRGGGDNGGVVASSSPLLAAPADNNNKEQQEPQPQQQQQLKQQQQRPQITGYVLGLKNGTTLRVPRPERPLRFWPQPLSGSDLAAPASLGDKQQQQQLQRPWQGLQDPPRVNLMSDRLQEMRERMNALLEASGDAPRIPAFGGAGLADQAPASPSSRPLDQRQDDELPQPQPEEDREYEQQKGEQAAANKP